MEIIGDFNTSVHRALEEIDPNYDKLVGLVVCGTHSPDMGKVQYALGRIQLARETEIPALLICHGYQLGAIEYARNVLGIKDATSEEFGEGTFVVTRRPEMKVGYHGGESWWSNFDVVIDWPIPDSFVAVPYHPEYQSSKENPHKDLIKFINECKK